MYANNRHCALTFRSFCEKKPIPFAFTALALVLASHAAAAENPQDTVHAYAIPAGTLNEALTEFADQTNIKLVFNADLARDLKSPALQEKLSIDQGLNRLLKNSGLVYRIIDNNTAIIEPKPAPEQHNKADPATLKPMTVKGNRDFEPNDPYNSDYNRSNAATATKTDTPIMETPISIQVVPRAVMQDQQSIQVGDAIKNVSGVFQGLSFGGFAETFLIRGFNTQFNNYLDGFRWPASRLTLANIERVEVVKGAAAKHCPLSLFHLSALFVWISKIGGTGIATHTRQLKS
ncbi:MAG: TonB-dependent receptor plug domain-containing protein [Methylobacter sp.]|nr:TonB-dependent receptor plug domain-containing protein [Methylobacter sp.]